MNENKGDIRYVGVKETLLYGIANAGQCFGYNIIAGSYLSLFFTKVFGVPPAAVAAMMLFLGLWDTFNDPLMGTIVDKTRTRYGKLRPYLLIVPIPLGLATILLFAGPELLGDKVTDVAKIIYMFVTYFFWELFYTLGDVPFWGMSAAISPSPSDRTRVISSARFISGILGGISTPILTVLMDLSNKGTIPLSLSQVFLLMSILSATYGMGGNNQPFVVNAPVTLKIRSGCEGGGKGAIWQEDKSATLSCNNDQTLFAPKAYGISAFESNAMKSDNPHSGVYEAETSRTLDCGGGAPSCNQGGMAIVESYALQGSMIGRTDKNGPQGDGINEDVSFTLNTCDKHAVVYAIDRETFNCGQNFARNLGISNNGVSSTLNAQGPSAVATPVYTSSKASFFTNAQADTANTLVATDYKDPPLINDVGYTVRRLTPQECALLQGMPIWWCDSLGTENPTDKEINRWNEIFESYNKAIGKECKPKSRKQIEKWLKNPYSDSAAYKMWGNGIALPCAWFVLAGINYYANI